MTALQTLKHNTIGDRAFYRRVVAILLPIIIQNTVTNFVNLLDNVMVGALGTLEMSAVAIVNQLLFIVNLAIFGGYSGPAIFCTQYVGAKDDEGVRRCFCAKIYIGLVCILLSAVIFLLFSDALISLYIADDTPAADIAATLQYAKDYLFIMLSGLPFFAYSYVYGSTLRELGDTKKTMIASVVAIAVNLAFNYVFIFGNQGLSFLPFGPMGPKGAAIATVISRVVEATVIVIWVHAKSHLYPFIKKVYRGFKIPKTLALSITRKSIVVLTNEVLWSTGMAALLQCYSARGLDVVAATNITNTASNLFTVVYVSMGAAISILLGHILGANEKENARITAWRLLSLSIFCCTVLGAVMAAVSPLIPDLYNTSETVKSTATNLLLVTALNMPFCAFFHGSYFVLRTGGKTGVAFVFDIGFMWGVAYPLAFVLVTFTQLPILPVYICVQAVELVKCIIAFRLVKRGDWINNVISIT